MAGETPFRPAVADAAKFHRWRFLSRLCDAFSGAARPGGADLLRGSLQRDRAGCAGIFAAWCGGRIYRRALCARGGVLRGALCSFLAALRDGGGLVRRICVGFQSSGDSVATNRVCGCRGGVVFVPRALPDLSAASRCVGCVSWRAIAGDDILVAPARGRGACFFRTALDRRSSGSTSKGSVAFYFGYARRGLCGDSGWLRIFLLERWPVGSHEPDAGAFANAQGRPHSGSETGVDRSSASMPVLALGASAGRRLVFPANEGPLSLRLLLCFRGLHQLSALGGFGEGWLLAFALLLLFLRPAGVRFSCRRDRCQSGPGCVAHGLGTASAGLRCGMESLRRHGCDRRCHFPGHHSRIPRLAANDSPCLDLCRSRLSHCGSGAHKQTGSR